MFDNERQFRKLVTGLKINAAPDPAHRRRLRQQMLETFEQAAPLPSGVPCWTSPLMHSSVAKLAVAAAVIVSAAAVFCHLHGPTDTVAADILKTRQAMEKMGWIHAVTTRGQDVETRWHDLAADRVFLTTTQGVVMCWDNGPAQKQFVYNPRARTLTVDNLPRRGFSGSGSVLAALDAILTQRQQDTAAVEAYADSYQGRKVKVFKAELGPTAGQTAGTRVIRVFMVDPKTRLVLAGSTDYLDKAGEVVARETLEVDYPQTGPASVYDLDVPASTKVIDRTQQPIGTPMDIPTPAPRGD